jgi:hypothetical protein
MPRVLPWSSAALGDLDVFVPAIPCLFVNTWYVNGEPDSTVSYFWQDEATGMIHHEILFNAPVSYEAAMEWAQAHASTSGIERIHVRHARPAAGSRRGGKKKAQRPAKKARTSARKPVAAGSKTAKAGKAKRRPGVKKTSSRR